MTLGGFRLHWRQVRRMLCAIEGTIQMEYFERWFQDECGNVIRENYRLDERGNKIVIERTETAYDRIPFQVLYTGA